MNSKNARLIVFCLVFLFPGMTVPCGERLPDHPDNIVFPVLNYTPPDPSDYLVLLHGEIPVFIMENREWPTFDIEVMVRAGKIHEPENKTGLADMTCSLLRNGGTAGYSPEAFEEKLSFLAAELTASALPDRSVIRLSLLQKDMGEGLALLKDMLEKPAFAEKEIARYRSDLLQNLKRRNDEPSRVERREWEFMLYGAHPRARALARTGETIEAITPEDLTAFHRAHFYPENYIIAVSCDLEREKVLQKLAETFPAGGGKKPETRVWREKIVPSKPPGVYLIDFPDAKQARVSMGHLGIREGNPDHYALNVMNYILGGGGFMSRITQRVRSDEGLSYSQGSTFETGSLYDGLFRAYFQSNNQNVAKGVGIILEEFNRIRTEKVADETLSKASRAIIEQLPSEFSDKFRTARTFASDYYRERPADYRKEYERRIAAITAEDIRKAAQKYIQPDRLFILIVGRLDEVKKTWDEETLGPIQTLPLRDPLTLK
jgi:zinc protease